VPRSDGFPVILPDFESIGPIARTVNDVVLVMQLITPPDVKDPLSLPYVGRPFELSEPRKCRILYVPRFGETPVDPEIERNVTESAHILAGLGHDVEQGSVPFEVNLLESAFGVIGRVGLAWLAQSLPEEYESFTPSIAEMVASGRSVAGTEYYAALATARHLRVELASFFDRYDILMTPSTAALPWFVEEQFPSMIAGQSVGPRAHAVFTGFVNMSGCPGITIPSFPSSDGLPIGFQLVAAEGQDALLCEIAARYERAMPWRLLWPSP
jgi:aspartyl-tRNA(Asn)/glutamyl-tRNA(Gln) amidotransferase subunit A